MPIIEDSGTVTGLICHIKARNKGGPRYDPKRTAEQRHAFENLILLCSRHSKIIDSDPSTFSVELLQKLKHRHESDGLAELSPSDAQRVARLLADYREIYIHAGGHVMLNSPGAIQATNVVIKNQKSTVKVLPTEEAIGSDLSKRNYVSHLIKRYQEFARQQPGRKFSFAAIHTAIGKHFGAKWELVSLHRFEHLASFLQQKIDGTMRGRMNRGKGISNYSSYEQFLAKYHHPHNL